MCKIVQQKDLQLNIPCMTRGKKASCRKALERLTASFVAFCTVLTLGISVIAQETDAPLCGLDHEHTASCFATEVPDVPPEFAGMVLHKHNDFCYDSARNLICPLPELEEHLHEDACYEPAAQETTEPETAPTEPAHQHTDACYTRVQGAQICNSSENSHTHADVCYETVTQDNPHTHTDSCYVMQQRDLTCLTPEYTGHTHGSDCYTQCMAPVCGIAESEEHAHESSCYEKVLVCVTREDPGHTHADSCYNWEIVLSCDMEAATSEKVLICTEPVHNHSEDCFQWTQELTCGMEELPPADTAPAEPEKVLVCTRIAFLNHIHSESCYETDKDGTQVLTCTRIQLEEHQHTASCLVFSDDALLCETEVSESHEHDYNCYSSWTFLCQLPESPEEPLPTEPESDPKADLERRYDWEQTVAHVKLTGDWSHDMLAIAQSQLGYKESTRNFMVTKSGDHKGYTRYGQWYGFPYGDWCAMFASFCLNYAGIEDFPLDCNCAHWVDVLTEANLYAGSDVYTPKPGDLVFFDQGRKSASAPRVAYGADHVAIAVGMIPATKDTPAKLMTIEGNHNDSVSCDVYDLTDPTIIGYGILPEGPAKTYSCYISAHIHGSGCYDEGENIACQAQEHTHSDTCGNRTFLFTDNNLQAEVTLTNAVFLPESLSLNIVPVEMEDNSSADAMVKATRKALSGEEYLAKDVYLLQFELTADGQPYQLPLGTQAEIRISFRKPVLASDAGAELRTLMLTAQKSGKTYKATQALSASCDEKDGGITGLYLFTDRLSTCSIVLAEAQE